MDRKNKRVLWLINHTTLREFEVPLLNDLGFEVFTPKHIPVSIEQYSGSVDYSYDKTLTISPEILSVLNNHDFYEGSITVEIREIINNFFGVTFCVFHLNLLDEIIKNFDGKILLRAFGLDKDRSYTEIINTSMGRNFLYATLPLTLKLKKIFGKC